VISGIATQYPSVANLLAIRWGKPSRPLLGYIIRISGAASAVAGLKT
jgi:hypothetical protein